MTSITSRVAAEKAALEAVSEAAVRIADYFDELAQCVASYPKENGGHRARELRDKILPAALVYYRQVKKQLMSEVL